MPIGRYKTFGALKASVTRKAKAAGRRITSPAAYAAAIARAVEPGFGKGPRKKKAR